VSKKKGMCALCGGGVDYQLIYGNPEVPHGWMALQCCFYCKAVFEQFTMGNVMVTRIGSKTVVGNQRKATREAKRIFKQARKNLRKE
jgi:hypothetical protein